MRGRLALALLVAAVAAGGCGEERARFWHGVIEQDAVLVASSVGGRLAERVPRGRHVNAGEVLFRLDGNPEALERKELQAEIERLDARLEQAALDEAHAGRELERLRRLARSDRFVPEEKLDAAKLAVSRAKAARRALALERKAAQARLARLDWALSEKVQRAPEAGIVDETFAEPGEWVAPNRPVVRLLPHGRRYLRFYLPERERAGIRLGSRLRCRADGVADAFGARVRWIAKEPEFTPPMIFSEDVRAAMVYRAEATLEEGAPELPPGQPVDVEAVR